MEETSLCGLDIKIVSCDGTHAAGFNDSGCMKAAEASTFVNIYPSSSRNTYYILQLKQQSLFLASNGSVFFA